MTYLLNKLNRRTVFLALALLALVTIVGVAHAAYCYGAYYIHYDAWGRPYHQHYDLNYLGQLFYTYWHY